MTPATLEARGYLADGLERSYESSRANYTGRLAGAFTLDDPLWYERDAVVLAVRASVLGIGVPTDLPLGTAPSNPVIVVYGPATTPIVITYSDALGNPVALFTLDVSLSATEWIVIDTSGMTVVKFVSTAPGTIPDGLALVEAVRTVSGL
jgi:hypothetical protein